MRFLFISARYWPDLGGTERRAALFASFLAKRGHEVTVLTQRARGRPSRESVGGIEVLRLAPSPGGRLSSALFGLQLAGFLARRGRGFDLFQVYLASSPALFTRPWAALLRKPVVLSFGGGGRTGDAATSGRTLLGRWKLRRLSRGFNLYFCPSSEIRREFLSWRFPRDRLVLLPNVVDADFFRPPAEGERRRLRRAAGWEGRAVGLFTGRLEPEKNLLKLVEAWNRVAKTRPEALLVLAGEGSQRPLLEKQIRALGLMESVHLAGTLDSEGVRRLLWGADLFILPSLAEGMSNSLLEAMSCGLAALVSDIPGNHDLIESGVDGHFFDPGVVEDLEASLGTLLGASDYRERLGEAARRKIITGYSLEKIGDRYLELVRGLFHKPDSR